MKLDVIGKDGKKTTVNGHYKLRKGRVHIRQRAVHLLPAVDVNRFAKKVQGVLAKVRPELRIM
jgi:hypothetical protein